MNLSSREGSVDTIAKLANAAPGSAFVFRFLVNSLAVLKQVPRALRTGTFCGTAGTLRPWREQLPTLLSPAFHGTIPVLIRTPIPY